MLSSVRLPIVTSYSEEVSGWDAAQDFFVEKTRLEWNEDTGKHVQLRRYLQNGALLFVRLVHSDAAPSYPVPYEAESLGATSAGEFGFRLHPVISKRNGDGRCAA